MILTRLESAMKLIYPLALLFLTVVTTVAPVNAAIVFSHDFESAGGYTTSTPEFSDGGSDYFHRTDGTAHSAFNVYNGSQGSFFFAANDIDGEGAAPSQTVSISGINITGQTSLTLDILLAEDDDGANQDWDADTSFSIFASIDGGTAFQILGVEAVGGTNTEPAIDTNFDGVGDGIALTDTFANFNSAIAGSGALLDLELRFDNFNAGDEDIGIDNIRINGVAVPEPSSMALLAVASVAGIFRRRRS